MPYQTLVLGPDAARRKAFRSYGNAVLLGTADFWKAWT
jgi:hypothetical protein